MHLTLYSRTSCSCESTIFRCFVHSEGLLGDYNANGTVDAADYVLWRNGGPLENEVATIGQVTLEDYTEWRARFGTMAGGGASLGISGAVPEPSCLALGLVLATLIPWWRARFDALTMICSAVSRNNDVKYV